MALEQEMSERERALVQIVPALNEQLSVEAAVRILVASAVELVHTPAAAVYLLSGDSPSFVPYAAHGLDLEQSEPRAFAVQTSIAGRVFQHKQPLYIVDSSAIPDVFYPQLLDGRMPHSLFTVPILIGDGSSGVLEIYSADERQFDDIERGLLITLAASVGIAFLNVRLAEKEAEARQAAAQLAHRVAEQMAHEQATIGALSDGIWICNQAGTIEIVNNAGLDMFGLDRKAVVGQPLSVFDQLLSVQSEEYPYLGLRIALQGVVVRAKCEVRVSHDYEPVMIDICTTPIRDEGGDLFGAVALVRDISRAATMERMRDDFLSIAAHELKTPITALKGYAQLALRRASKMSEIQDISRTLTTIDEQADRINSLINKLLEVSHIRSGQLELHWSYFDLQALIVSVVSKIYVHMPQYPIIVSPHPPILMKADRERLKEVVYNLLDNGVKYSQPGVPIEVMTKMVDGNVLVLVRDRGLGIPVEQLPFIFDQWYQAHDATSGDYGGMGLGLYISKQIVEQHGGSIWVTSSEAEGTTAGFTIPRIHNVESEPEDATLSNVPSSEAQSQLMISGETME